MKAKLTVVILAFLVMSCGDDFTNLAPISQRNVDNFFTNANDFELAVNGAYSALHLDGMYSQSLWVMFEMRSDNTDQGPDVTGLANELAVIHIFNENSLNQFLGDMYRDHYVLISRTNVILDRLGEVTMSDAQRDQIQGQALFLRSLAYYNLAIAFANVPLILNEVTDINQSITQSNRQAILEQIAGDLSAAEGLLPDSWPASQQGRATRGAALALLGKVHLMLGNNGQAETALRAVTTLGYSLVPDYADLWGAGNENNSESIFEVQYRAGGLGTGSPFTNYFSPSPFLQNGLGNARNRPTESMWEAYEAGDLRRDISMARTYVNPNTNEVVEALHILKYRSEPFQNNDSDVNWPVLRYADVLLMLAEAIGESPEAYGYINQVRQRAGLPDIDANTPGTFADKLLQERRVELAFENHRWPDLIRFDRAEQAMQQLGLTARMLFPIPQREIDVTPGFTQNP
ncbi:MAG: SusD family sugar-binding outer membrane protein [Bacteroidetes bacterium HLUCCA01]|nr:MAG: SusD family sugar-binding outer membrane protein [Bacteroidetes bacterium HLUCCA01]